MFWITLIAFLIILGLLVFAHELGHFSAAKLLKVKVEEFAFGFPPKIFCRKRGETKYCINAIPFGGYVKMLGEDKTADSPRSFSSKNARSRIVIVVAGVLMNFILAGLLFSGGYMIGMSPIRLDEAKMGGIKTYDVTVAEIKQGSIAEKEGIKPGDIIRGFKSSQEFSNFTKEKRGSKINIQISRGKEQIFEEIDLSADETAPLGVGIVDLASVKLPFFAAIAAGFKEMVLTTVYIAELIVQLFIKIFTSGQVGDSVAGPVKIFNVTGDAVEMGLNYLLQFAALLSINVGLVNILPFPALDGGRAVLILLEGVFRKKVMKEELENILHTVGFVILIGLIVIITFREIVDLL